MLQAVILTALRVEYQAVREHLSDLREQRHPQGTIYERGTFIANEQKWQVAILEVGAGNLVTAGEAERAINYFNPSVMFFVGVAGGIKDVAIGDVVVATKVYEYESGKAKVKFEPRPGVENSAYELIQRARAEARKPDWLQRLASLPDSTPEVFIAPIAAGEKVVASTKSSFFKLLRLNYGDAVAVEMEGGGLLKAAYANHRVLALVIRGISDLIEGKNDDSIEPEKIRQKKASHHASAFAFEILAKVYDESLLQIQKNDVKQKQDNLRRVDRELEPYLSEPLKQVVDWLENSKIDLAKRIVREALEKCPNLKQKVKCNSLLENRINWEAGKYIEIIHNSLMTKDVGLLYQPPISPFTTQECNLFSPEERESFKAEEGKFYTSLLYALKEAIPIRRFSDEIKLEMKEFIDILRDNLPKEKSEKLNSAIEQ